MALTYLGSLTVGAINPALGASLAIVLPKLQAELAAAVAAKASIEVTPMTIALSLDLAGRLVADIQAAIALGVQWPSISVQLQLYLDLIASIQLSLGLLTFDLGAAGIHAYAYDGTASGLGPALPSSLPGGGPSDPCNALVLATSIPSSWAALAQVLKVV